MKFNLNQKKVIADILGNFAIAWISIGVISQTFFAIKNIVLIIVSIISFVILSLLSVYMLK